jgi:putative component of membrane protein insertase Oxa1/YidC/SpoIIIJ protein YidD
LLLLLILLPLVLLFARPAALLAIDGYQRFVSPYKGYSCAHGVFHGGLSCSEYGKQVIDQEGVLAGLVLLQQRFRDCSRASQMLGAIGSAPVPAGACIEGPEEVGKRDAEETKEYCCGCVQGCLSFE